ncbi:MAG: lysophospholipid acyltransferase family protein [Acidobacteriota bacterium]
MKAHAVALATWLLRFVPESVAMALAMAAADLCWIGLPRRRRTIEGNLRYTAPGCTARERRRLVRATLRNLARCTVDFLRIPLMTRAELASLIEWQDRAPLDQALALGRGAILLGGHLGNWELAGPWFAALGYPAHVYAEVPSGDTELFRVYERYRGATGMRVIPVSGGARPGYRALARGHVVALLADRVITGPSCVVDFCGGRRRIPVGAAALARWSGAPVFFFHVTEQPGGPARYRGVLEPLDASVQRGEEEAFARRLSDLVSRVVFEHPDQWFVFQPDWLAGESATGPRVTSRDGSIGVSQDREAAQASTE